MGMQVNQMFNYILFISLYFVYNIVPYVHVYIKLICRGLVAYPSPGAVSPNGVTVNS